MCVHIFMNGRKTCASFLENGIRFIFIGILCIKTVRLEIVDDINKFLYHTAEIMTASGIQNLSILLHKIANKVMQSVEYSFCSSV